MIYLLFLDELEVVLSIGLHDFERSAPQRVLVSVALAVEMPEDAPDAIDAVYDYDPLRAYVHALANDPHLVLQETLCRRVAHWCKRDPRVVGGWVRSAKPDVYPDARAVGCQIAWGDPQSYPLLALAGR